MTWAGERSEQPRSFQSPEMFFLLTLPFIERAYRSNGSSAPQGRVEKRAELAREAESETSRDFHGGFKSSMPAVSAVTMSDS